MHYPLIGAAALAAALLPIAAQSASLSLELALDLAVQRSETAHAGRAGQLSATETARAAGRLPDPTLIVGVDNLPVTGPDRFSTTRDSMTMKRIGISQEWLPRGKREARSAAAEAAVQRESIQVQAALAETRLQAALAYVDAFYAGEALKLTTLMEHHAHEELEAARGRLAASAGGSQEVLALTAARGTAEDESAQVRQERGVALVALQRWVGVRSEDLLPPPEMRTPTEEEYVAAHPSVLALTRDIQVARRQAAVTESERNPNWTWGVSYGQRTGYSDMVSFGVSIPIPLSPSERQDRDTAAKLAVADKAEADLAEATRAASAEYRALASDSQRLEERIQRYRTGVLTPATQRISAATAAYASNQSSLVTLFEARHAEVEMQRKLLALRRDLMRAKLQMRLKPLEQGSGAMKRVSLGVVLVVGLAIAVGSFYLGRVTQRASMTALSNAASESGRTVLYWHDPMVPGQRFDKPGKSPYMDMQLVPVYADSAAASGVQVSSAVQQNLGIRYATVRRATMSSSFDAVGTVQFDERRNVAVQTRVAGYVERLAVRAPMERVRRGQALATVFAPDWMGPQNELIALKRSGVSEDVVAAARARLRALSVPDDLVRRSEEAGTAQARFTLVSPEDGVVAELGVREGVAVAPGTTLFRIAGLQTVWAVAEVPEAQAMRLVPGQKVKATLQADASQTFEGELKEILPEVSTATRTLKARFEVDNRAGRLTPGMLLRLAVAGPQSERLVVSSEAVIRTGKRAVVIVRDAQGGFEPRDVSLGVDFGDDVEVITGLHAGDQVVASGQFLIDSEARLRSVLGTMSALASAAAASMPASPVAIVHDAQGKVESATADSLTISHGPVAALKWPAMTMGFAKPDPKAFADVRAGDTVHFRFKEGGSSGYELVEVHKIASGATK